MKVKFGILGYGFMGHVHVDRLMKFDGAEVVAVCDIDPAKLSEAPSSLRRYTDMDGLFQDGEVNTVIVCIPNHLHREAVIKAARAGKNILCEKPAAMSVQELDEMEKVAKACGVVFTVHQQRRWDKDFRTAKEVYDSKALGSVYTVQSKLYGYNGNMHDWHVYRKFGGGMLFDWGVHLIDQMLYMIDGKITLVFADMRNVINREVDDYFKIVLRFENGVTGEIELGTYFLKDAPGWFERHWFIGGDKGSMYSDGFMPQGGIVRTTRLLQNVPGKTTMTASGPTRSFGPPAPGLIVTEALPEVECDQIDYFRNFVRAMNGEERFAVTIPQARRVLALMEAVRQSAVTGQSVRFE